MEMNFELQQALTFALSDNMEIFYSPRPLRATIGYVSPIEVEVAFLVFSSVAAGTPRKDAFKAQRYEVPSVATMW